MIETGRMGWMLEKELAIAIGNLGHCFRFSSFSKEARKLGVGVGKTSNLIFK